MIVIIDYGMGNPESILNMFKRIGIDSTISGDATIIRAADKLILPGVGAFDHGMNQLREKGLIALLNQKVLTERCPVLGICLGAQLLTKSSEEGSLPGLGWVNAHTRRFRSDLLPPRTKIPHMGWNEVTPAVQGKDIFEGYREPPRFYFVHSYHICCEQPEDILATANYGYNFSAAIRRDNVVGAQYHPEKSHKFGMLFLSNWNKISE